MFTLTCVVIATFVLAIKAQQCPLTLNQPAEKKVLEDLYRDTQGFTWLVNVQWPTAGQANPADPCCWIGITCKLIVGRGVHVTEINLAYNNLKGKLPDSIGNLPYLTVLLLHQNRIGGTVPASLSNLREMELLFLNNNRFEGALPSLRNMRKLQAVYLEENAFTGSFPVLTGLNFLETIDVSNNQLTGPLPPQITNGNLADIRANKNKFTGPIPPAWLRLATLQSVQLAENELTGAVPAISTAIKVFYINDNKLGCYAPQTSGADVRITGNKFLCQPGVQRVVGCVNPSIAQLITPPQGVVQLSNTGAVPATLTVADADPIRDCPDMYCYLGTQRQGIAKLNAANNQIACTLNPTAVGSYSLSLRRQDGTVITQQADGGAIIVRVKAGCGGPGGQCNSPQGVCTADGCVCNQAEGWSGAACDEKICPRNCFETTEPTMPCPPGMQNPCVDGGLCNAQGQCADQGKCNKQTGLCKCNYGFGGADCSLKQIPCPGDPECSGRGRCQRQTGICNCFPQPKMLAGRTYTERYTGNACQDIVCPMLNGQECSGHGSCVAGVCQCQQYFQGLSHDCSVGNVPCNNCNGANARCDGNTGNCECARGFKGPGCAERSCPATDGVECSGHGVCDGQTGKCACQSGWDLVGSCAAMRIPCPMHPNGKPCGGPQFGNCRQATGVCKCVDNEKRAFTGTACETPICPTIWENCNIGALMPPRGTCVDAKCQCNPGYAGPQCIDKECILGSDGSQCNEDSAQGTCDVGSGICECLADANGEGDPKVGCGSILCPNSNNAYDCGGKGKCDDGVCVCDDGFDGEGCENTVTPIGPIIGAVVGSICYILSCAVCVFFFLRQRAIAQLTEA